MTPAPKGAPAFSYLLALNLMKKVTFLASSNHRSKNPSRHREEYNMELKEIKCSNCRKEIYIQQPYVREKMFCTLGCRKSYQERSLRGT
jgi:hypothetical protein